MNIDNSLIIVFGGITCCGMTTQTKMLLEKYPQDIEYIPGYCTRPMRPGSEKQGDPYWFITLEEFKRLDREGKLLEKDPAQNEHWYGKPLEPFEKAVQEGRICLVYINYRGIESLVTRYGQRVRVCWIDITKAEAERRYRLRCKAEGEEFTEEKLAQRLARADEENHWLQNEGAQLLKTQQLRIIDGQRPREEVHQDALLFVQPFIEHVLNGAT